MGYKFPTYSMKQIALPDATKSLLEYVSELDVTTGCLVFVDGEKPVVALVQLDTIDLETLLSFWQKKSRLARECAKLDVAVEQALAEEGMAADLDLWPKS